MSKATDPIPVGHEGLIPHLLCEPCADAMCILQEGLRR